LKTDCGRFLEKIFLIDTEVRPCYGDIEHAADPDSMPCSVFYGCSRVVPPEGIGGPTLSDPEITEREDEVCRGYTQEGQRGIHAVW
jgi:hypothetical protein